MSYQIMNCTENNLGFFTPKEVRLFTGVIPEQISKASFFLEGHSDDEALKRFLSYRGPKLPPELAPQGRPERAGNSRLVQRRKSPTREDLAKESAQKELKKSKQRLVKWKDLFRDGNVQYVTPFVPSRVKPIELDWKDRPLEHLKHFGFVENAPVMARFLHRDWSGEYRIRLESQARPSEAPPAQGGDRFTEEVTSGAVRKIFESGAFVQSTRDGYSTFITLTFTPEQRERVLTRRPQSKNRTKPGQYGSIVVMSPHGREPYRVKAEGAFTWLDDMGKAGELAVINMAPIKGTGRLDVHGHEIKDIGTPSVRASGPWTKIREYAPDSSIGNEVSRFLDGAQKMYQRGWIPAFRPARKKRGKSIVQPAGVKCGEVIADGPFTPIRKGDQQDKLGQNPRWKEKPGKGLQKVAVPLDYCWVAEMPANEHGEPNPHVHVLFRWRVPKSYFHAWAGRLEGLWGNGFAKIEKIKHAKAGAGYLVKAVGYAAKGRDGNQGLIRGNRYGISACARAPGWHELASFQADNMAAIIAELEEKLYRRKVHHEEREKRAFFKLKESKRQYQITKNSKQLSEERRAARLEKLKAMMLQQDQEIAAAKADKHATGVIASGHYQITFTGENASEKFDRFLGWAVNNRQWQANARNEQLKEELEQEKAALIASMQKEYAELQDDLNLDDNQIERLRVLHFALREVNQDIDYKRMMRLQMANTLRQQRSYWRNFADTLPAKRTSLDYWSSFLNRYELSEPPEDRDLMLSLQHQDDLLCVRKAA
ncbi:hypothetical protein [Photobacterium galatheae]|nr:hypothetical protein [Photobacterium galatheae]MCM0151535.1 hypothetical protein [Photobacterium galatheae]